jgi:chemotaxis protein MotB
MAGGHGGGSWKVAYADFMTSMFALFLCLWIMGADEETKRAIEDYFQGKKTNIHAGQKAILEKEVTHEYKAVPQDHASKEMVSINPLQQAVEEIRKQLSNSSEVGDDQIRFDYTADGVRITMIDKAKKPFFDAGTSNLTPFGQFVLQTIGWQIERLPVQVEIEGHTEQSEGNDANIRGWQTSTERAVSSEQALGDSGVKAAQFFRIAGKGASDPIDPANPGSEDNRRIAIVLRPGAGEDPDSFRQKMKEQESP